MAFLAASSQRLQKSVALELAQEGAKMIICGRNKDTLIGFTFAQTQDENKQGILLL